MGLMLWSRVPGREAGGSCTVGITSMWGKQGQAFQDPVTQEGA